MKKEILISVYVGILSGLFLLVSLLLYLTGGKNQFLLGRKLKIGAVIITLTALVGCSGVSEPVRTCYKVVAQDHVTVSFTYNDQDLIELKKGTTDIILNGQIMRRTLKTFSFMVFDHDDKEILKGEIKPSDGQFDEETEDFIIKLPEDLKVGRYTLKLFRVSLKDLDKNQIDNPCNQMEFFIIGNLIETPIPDEKLTPRYPHRCYSPVMPMPHFTISKVDPSKMYMEFDLKKNNIIKGEIRDVRGTEFSFRIEDKDRKLVQAGTIKPLDGKWNDKQTEDYQIELDKKLNPGQYIIYMFEVPKSKQEKNLSHFLNSFYIKIIK